MLRTVSMAKTQAELRLEQEDQMQADIARFGDKSARRAELKLVVGLSLGMALLAYLILAADCGSELCEHTDGWAGGGAMPCLGSWELAPGTWFDVRDVDVDARRCKCVRDPCLSQVQAERYAAGLDGTEGVLRGAH